MANQNEIKYKRIEIHKNSSTVAKFLAENNDLRHKNLYLIYNGSVAIDYFFKRKKYFNQIFE